MRVKHLDFTLNSVFVPDPKNRRSRYVPFTRPLRAFLTTLIAGKGPEDFALPHWSYTWILNTLKATAKSLGIKGITPHVLRHTFAYNLLSQGKSIYQVSLLMGHSSVAVTQKHYGHLAAKDLRDTLDSSQSFLSCNRIATETLEIVKK